MKATRDKTYRKQLSFKKLSISIVSAMLLLPVVCFGGDISKDIYCLYTQSGWLGTCGSAQYSPTTTNNDNETFYVREKTTYSEFGHSFTANYTNGTLIFGNDEQAAGTGSVWFGSGVYAGFITGVFNAKDIYFTGAFGAGNGDGAGAGASFTMNATENITANNLTASFWSNTQNDIFTLNGKNITITNSSFTIDGADSKLTLEASEKLTTENFTLSMPKTTGTTQTILSGKNGIDMKGGSIQVYESSTAGVNSAISFLSEKGNITFDDKVGFQTYVEKVNFIAKNGDINLQNILNIQAGANTTDGVVTFQANGNIALNTLNATLVSGKGQLNIKAGGDITINNFTALADLGIAVNDTNFNFEGKNITLSNGSISSNRGIQDKTDAAGQLNTTFKAEENITLNNIDIALISSLLGANPDSLTFIGKNLTHTGKLYVAPGWQHTWEGVTFDFSGITGKSDIGTLDVVAAIIKGSKSFEADMLHIQARQTNGGFGGKGTLFYMKEGGEYKFDKVALDDAGSVALELARLSFFDADGNNSFVKGSSLTIGDLSLGNTAGLYAYNVATTNVQNFYLGANASANFNRLNIINNGSITMNHNSTINIKTSFDVNIKLESNTLDNYGKPILSIVNAGENMENIKVQAGTVYRFIDTKDGIKYHFDYVGDKQNESFNCDGSREAECAYIKNAIAIYAGDPTTQTTNNTIQYGTTADGKTDYTTYVNADGTIASRKDLSATCNDGAGGQNPYNCSNGGVIEALGLRYEKVVNFSTIGIQFLANNPDNPYDIGDIRYYIWQKGGKTNGDAYVREIAALYPGFYDETITQTQNGQKIYTNTQGEVCQSTSAKECEASGYTPHQVQTTNSDIFKWLNELSIKQNGITWTGTNILNYDFNFFKQTAIQLNNTLDQIASIERKNSASTSTRLAADVAKVQRLVKLSRDTDRDEGIQFADYIKSLAKTRYAKANNQASDYEASQSESLDSGFLYKYSNRHTFANNIWATGIGSASFVSNGYGMLYGVNVGYDRFLPFGDNAIVIGGLVAYGYGSYNADLIRNTSHNVNTGIYSRAFIKNNEIDFNISYTLGLNNEDLITRQNIWLSNLGQKYNYNTHTINTNLNWGYIFGKKKGLVFKPTIGMSYYYIAVGQIQGKNAYIDMANDINFTTRSPEVGKSVLALNLALETRQYLSKGSYWFVNVGAAKDIFISANNAQQVDFVTASSINYTHGDDLNTFVNGTAGGEIALREQVFVNFALGGKVGLSYKDINITANLGGRYVF